MTVVFKKMIGIFKKEDRYK